jgi:hypothetical protein
MDRHYATNPAQAGECPREVHDRYWTYGPDGKVYPAWHPPVDPITGCAFGHEHGSDPALSRLGNLSVPFGYANEKLYELDMVNFRDEDHVGHKVFVINDGEYSTNGIPNGIRCDTLVKAHQGTHSPDALANNLHEMHMNATCNNGVYIRWKNLHPFGAPGRTFVNCTAGSNDYTYSFGTAVPPNSPTGGGSRNVPDIGCARASGINMAEDWPVDADLAFPGGGGFGYGLYLQVTDASRFVTFANGVPNGIGRPTELCANATHQAYNSPECAELRANFGNLAWNDPRSPWKGVIRRVHINQVSANNPSNVPVWYTNVFGEAVASTRNLSLGVVVPQILRGRFDNANEGPQLNFDFSHPTVRSPN